MRHDFVASKSYYGRLTSLGVANQGRPRTRHARAGQGRRIRCGPCLRGRRRGHTASLTKSPPFLAAALALSRQPGRRRNMAAALSFFAASSWLAEVRKFARWEQFSERVRGEPHAAPSSACDRASCGSRCPRGPFFAAARLEATIWTRPPQRCYCCVDVLSIKLEPAAWQTARQTHGAASSFRRTIRR